MKNILAGGLLAALLAFSLPLAAQVQGADPAVGTVEGFYDALTASMKSGGTAKSRYEKLKPAVERAFDLPAMTALSVGASWASIAPAEQKQLVDGFSRMTIASYAANFDSYGGEKFPVDPAASQRGADKFVKSSLKPAKGEAIPFNYRLHQVGADWKIVDVYLNGNISQLAQKRSDFGATLQSGGAAALIKKINALADQTLQ